MRARALLQRMPSRWPLAPLAPCLPSLTCDVIVCLVKADLEEDVVARDWACPARARGGGKEDGRVCKVVVEGAEKRLVLLGPAGAGQKCMMRNEL